MQLSPAAEAHLSRVESFVVKDKVDAGCPWLRICMERFKCLCSSCNVWVKISGKEAGRGRESRQEQIGVSYLQTNHTHIHTKPSNIGWENNPMLEKVWISMLISTENYIPNATENCKAQGHVETHMCCLPSSDSYVSDSRPVLPNTVATSHM